MSMYQNSRRVFKPGRSPSNMSMMSEKKTTEKYCWAASSEFGCRLVRRNRVACTGTQRNTGGPCHEFLYESKGFCWPPLSLRAVTQQQLAHLYTELAEAEPALCLVQDEGLD